MCLQCTCESKQIGTFGKVSVQISTIDHPNWPLGLVGLIQSNDPFVVFDIKWVSDPNFGLSNSFITADYSLFFESAKKLSRQLCIDLSSSYFLMKNLIKSGYSQKIHGIPECYILHKVALMLKA